MPEYVTLSEYARFEDRVITSLRELRAEVADTKALVLNVQAGLQAHIDTVALTLNTKIDAVRSELKGDINSLRSELKGDINSLRGEIQYANMALAALCAHMGIELPRQ